MSTPIRLQAQKPNRTPHQTWQGEFVAQSGEWLVVYTPLGTPVRHHTKDLTYIMQHSNLGIFSTQKYYNVFVDFKPDGSFKQLYINVAMPATWDAEKISTTNAPTLFEVSWIDLELDITVRPGSAPELLDEDEFAAAKASGALDLELAARAEATAAQLMRQASSGEFPFLAVGYNAALKEVSDRLSFKYSPPSNSQ